MFFKRPWIYIGTELAPSYFYITKKNNYNFYSSIPSIHLNAVFQRWFTNRMTAVNFRIGAGFSSFYKAYFNFGGAGKSPTFTSMVVSIDAGASLMWFVRKPFFLEAGIDYIQIFSADSAWPGYIKPFISAGYQF
jgi:hypothetical protein